MATQFIAHATEPRTFADKKGALKAARRDLAKHEDAHGGELFSIGMEASQTANGRWGVVIFCDLDEAAARAAAHEELSGYVIQAERPDEKPLPKLPPERREPAKPKTKGKARRAGEVSVDPSPVLYPCRAGSKQQAMVDALANGATMDDLRKVCVKRDGTVWDDNSIRSGLYYDVRQKGYGIRTVWNGDLPTYYLVLPEGYDAPLAAKSGKS